MDFPAELSSCDKHSQLALLDNELDSVECVPGSSTSAVCLSALACPFVFTYFTCKYQIYFTF